MFHDLDFFHIALSSVSGDAVSSLSSLWLCLSSAPSTASTAVEAVGILARSWQSTSRPIARFCSTQVKLGRVPALIFLVGGIWEQFDPNLAWSNWTANYQTHQRAGWNLAKAIKYIQSDLGNAVPRTAYYDTAAISRNPSASPLQNVLQQLQPVPARHSCCSG